MTLHNQHLTQETLTAVNWFFRQYETASTEQLVSSAFSDPTVVGDLSGSRHVPPSVLAKGMVERAERLRSLGLEKTTLESWNALELSSRHVLLTAHWQLQFGAESISLTSDYLFELENGKARCLTYTTRQNVIDEIRSLDPARS